MENKLMYIPNVDTQNYPFCSPKLETTNQNSRKFNFFPFGICQIKYTPLIRWLVIAGNDIEKKN